MPPAPRSPALITEDLDRLFASGPGPFEALRGASLLLTGGTGFFGGWLLEAILYADARFRLRLHVTVLTRDPAAFYLRRPHLAADPAVALHTGDVRTFTLLAGPFTHVIHAATTASARQNAEAPELVYDTIVEGTRRALEAARTAGAKRLLFTSSGAVYGRQPPELPQLSEEFWLAPAGAAGGPNQREQPGVRAGYAQGKRAAERLCTEATAAGGPACVLARCFAFTGPYLPLDREFATGNFIRDAVAGGPIQVAGDGTAVRSYLYGADLAFWLVTLLTGGEPGRAYNVGSEQEVSIAQLARLVSRAAGGCDVEVAREAAPQALPERYVPSTQRARDDLGLQERFTLEEQLVRMLAAAKLGLR